MHATSIENMQRMIYENKNKLPRDKVLQVIELGSYTETGHDSYRNLFKNIKIEY